MAVSYTHLDVYKRQDLARPLVRDMRWAHNQRGTGPPIRQHMDCAQSHIGLARAALGDDARCLCLAQILGSPSNGKPLCGERLAQKGRYCRSNGVFGACLLYTSRCV